MKRWTETMNGIEEEKLKEKKKDEDMNGIKEEE